MHSFTFSRLSTCILYVFCDSGVSFSFLNAKGSNVWVQTIIFTMKYIEIRKSFIEYCSHLGSTEAFACICVDLI